MRNPVIATAHFGPVYARKIHVYTKGAIDTARWYYAWSTNAHRTCRDAVTAAQALHPGQQFKASFARA